MNATRVVSGNGPSSGGNYTRPDNQPRQVGNSTGVIENPPFNVTSTNGSPEAPAIEEPGSVTTPVPSAPGQLNGTEATEEQFSSEAPNTTTAPVIPEAEEPEVEEPGLEEPEGPGNVTTPPPGAPGQLNETETTEEPFSSETPGTTTAPITPEVEEPEVEGPGFEEPEEPGNVTTPAPSAPGQVNGTTEEPSSPEVPDTTTTMPVEPERTTAPSTVVTTTTVRTNETSILTPGREPRVFPYQGPEIQDPETSTKVSEPEVSTPVPDIEEEGSGTDEEETPTEESGDGIDEEDEAGVMMKDKERIERGFRELVENSQSVKQCFEQIDRYLENVLVGQCVPHGKRASDATINARSLHTECFDFFQNHTGEPERK